MQAACGALQGWWLPVGRPGCAVRAPPTCACLAAHPLTAAPLLPATWRVALLCLQCQLAELKQMACAALGLPAEDWEVFDFRGGQQGDCVSGRRLCCAAGLSRGGGVGWGGTLQYSAVPAGQLWVLAT